MIRFDIDWGSISGAGGWCSKNIGERTYWIHNKIGGHGWEIRENKEGLGKPDRGPRFFITFQDEADAIVYRLAYGK
jgi:hypothetical protein